MQGQIMHPRKWESNWICAMLGLLVYCTCVSINSILRLLSVVESMDNGKPIRESRDCDIPLIARHFYHHSGQLCICHVLALIPRPSLPHTGWAQLMDTEMQGWAPIGVVAAIVPWNFPLMLLSWKVHVYYACLLFSFVFLSSLFAVHTFIVRACM